MSGYSQRTSGTINGAAPACSGIASLGSATRPALRARPSTACGTTSHVPGLPRPDPAGQARLGHADAATTLREYADALPLADGSVADAINDHLDLPPTFESSDDWLSDEGDSDILRA